MGRTDRNMLIRRQGALRGVRLLWLVLMVCLSVRGFTGEFETGNQVYEQGNFAEAKRDYEKLVESGGGSANVFYNLGNIDYRLGALGPAVLNYERTLALNPHHPEAQANLKLLREKGGAKLLPHSQTRRLASQFTANTWTIIAAVAGWMAILGWVLFVARPTARFSMGALGLCGLVVAVGTVLILRNIAKDQALGIITAAQTEARLAPAVSAGVAEALPAGSQVRVLSERGEWVYCELPNAGRGWIPVGEVERVRSS